jgi:hypothetical protein
MRILGAAVWFLVSILGFAQTARSPESLSVPKGARILVRMADSDCESDRFESRLERELTKRGFIAVNEPQDFDYELRVSFRARDTEGKVEAVSLKQIYKEKNNPAESTVNADWPSIPPADRAHVMSNSVIEEISSWKDRVRTVYIAEAPPDLKAEVTSRLEASGYNMLSTPDGADLTVRLLPTSSEETKPQQQIDYAYQLFERKKNRLLYAQRGTKLDPGIYEEPLDLVAGAAIAIGRSILLKH